MQHQPPHHGHHHRRSGCCWPLRLVADAAVLVAAVALMVVVVVVRQVWLRLRHAVRRLVRRLRRRAGIDSSALRQLPWVAGEAGCPPAATTASTSATAGDAPPTGSELRRRGAASATSSSSSLLLRPHHLLPPLASLVTPSATDLARRIRSGELSSEQVLLAHIGQAEAANRCLNAIADRRYEAALATARECDRRLTELRAAGDATGLAALPPFFGVPCSVKEVFAVAGMRQTSGLVARRAFVASEDAPPVRRLKDAGFIPFVSSTVSELCMWFESATRLHGVTRNAYDHHHIVGGSSGGEGALISAAAAPVGIGSDIGG